MSQPPSDQSSARGRPIDVGPAFAGFGVAWITGQVTFVIVVMAIGALTLDDFDIEDPTPIPLLFLGTAGTWTILLAVMWWLSRQHGSGRPVADYAVRWRWVDLAWLPIGALTQLVAVPLVYWPLAELWPGTFSDEAIEERATDLVDRATGVGMVLLVIMVVVGAPLVEELVYRGLLQGSLAGRFGGWIAVVAASTIFAVIHFSPVEIPGLFVAGLVFGAGAMVTGRLGPAISAHAGFNIVGLLIASW